MDPDEEVVDTAEPVDAGDDEGDSPVRRRATPIPRTEDDEEQDAAGPHSRR